MSLTQTNQKAPKKAMVLAAGFGLRMRPITERLPKPMIKLAGRSLLDRAIDRLVDAGVETVVVNTHHLGHLIEQHIRKRTTPEIILSPEDPILETGGGVAKARHHFGDEPFYVVNSDAVWLNGPTEALGRMVRLWDPDTMDALLLLHSTAEAYGYTGVGDFTIDTLGKLTRRPEREVSPYLFTGVQIVHPRLYDDAPEGAFSANVLYDAALEKDRLYGLVHDGEWFHIGTPEGLAEAEEYMRERFPGHRKR